MTIVCGSDLSKASELACEIAGSLARRAGAKLVLLHAAPDAASRDEAAKTLEGIAAGLRKDGHEVLARVETGTPDTVIPRVAVELKADLIVVAASSRTSTRWTLGSSTDRIASATEIPLLVVREGAGLREWAEGSKPLSIAIATDLSPISEEAVAWCSRLSGFGACHFTVVHLATPAEAYHRLGIEGPLLLDQTHPAVGRGVRRALEATAERLRACGESEIILEESSGNAADDLGRLAVRAGADLLVVGHQPNRTWRVWEGSVARAVMRSAAMSVACIPLPAGPSTYRVEPIARVFAATDLSAAGNSAVAHALALLPRGEITILHVVEDVDFDESRRGEIIKGLERLASDCGVRQGEVDVKFELLESENAAEAICSAAEKAGAGLLCIASRGRSMLPRILLGSVAQEVLLLSRIPVLVVPPESV